MGQMFDKIAGPEGEDRADHRLLTIGLGLFAAIAVLIVVDLFTDYRRGVEPGHVLGEGVILMLAAVGTALLAWRWVRLRRHARQLRGQLAHTRQDLQKWRNEAQDLLAGLGASIDRQFRRWDLTPAEREVGLMLLKGLGHKEIARIRRVSERTVRQQAHALYQKAALPGRAELAAFFLEDLLLPGTANASETEGKEDEHGKRR